MQRWVVKWETAEGPQRTKGALLEEDAELLIILLCNYPGIEGLEKVKEEDV